MNTTSGSTTLSAWCYRHWILTLIIMAVVGTYIGLRLIFTIHDNQIAANRESYSISCPRETYYFDLEYAKASDPLEMQLLCTELAAEGKCVLEADQTYRIRFPLPKIIAEEYSRGFNHWEIDIGYTSLFEPDGPMPMVYVKIYNIDSGTLCTARSAFTAAEDVAQIRHKLVLSPEGEKGITLEEFTNDGLWRMENLDFILETSSDSNGETYTDVGNSIYAWTIHGEDQ